MDIAALLMPGAAPTGVGSTGNVAAAENGQAAPDGQFALAFVEAMGGIPTTGSHAPGASAPATGVDPTAVAPAPAVPSPLTTTAELPNVEPPQIEVPPLTATPPPNMASPSVEAPSLEFEERPPDPPPASRKAAKLPGKEVALPAPNAQAPKLDQPEETKTEEETPANEIAEGDSAASAAPANAIALMGSQPVVPISAPTPKTDEAPTAGIAANAVPQAPMAAPLEATADRVAVAADAEGSTGSITDLVGELRQAMGDGSLPGDEVAIIDTSNADPSLGIETKNVGDKTIPTQRIDKPELASPIKVEVGPVRSDEKPTPVKGVAGSPAKPVEAEGSAVLTAGNDSSSDTDSEAKGGSQAKPDSTPVAAPERTRTGTAATSAIDRPEAGQLRQQIDRPALVRQVADRIESMVAARPREGVTVHLEPRDLGTVTLVVKGAASALDVRMYASDDRVKESLNETRNDLAQALAPRGIAVRDVRIADAPLPNSSSAMGSGTSGQRSPDDRPRQAFAQANANQSNSRSASNGTPVQSRPPSRISRGSRGVDLLI